MNKETLVLLAQRGDRKALAQLWEAVRSLLYGLAYRFYTHYGADTCTRHGVTLEDLQQECYFALLDAVRAYKPEKGFQFTTYLSHASKNRFRACMGILSTHRNALDYADSMNRPADEEGDTESGDLIPDPRAAAEMEAVDIQDERRYRSAMLETACAPLSFLQKEILKRVYRDKQTRPQAALALHVTPATVRREEAKALRALRGDLRVLSLADEYLETAAYKQTGWCAWYYQQASVEERIVEKRVDKTPGNRYNKHRKSAVL